MNEISSIQKTLLQSKTEVRSILDNFDRNKILEIYFSRAEGFYPKVIEPHVAPIYGLELEAIKDYLMNQQPIDPILHRVFNLTH